MFSIMIFISSLSPINLILIISTFLNFLFKKLHHQRYSFLSIYNTFSTDTFALTAFFQNYIYIHICSRAPLSSYFWYTLIAITNPLVECRLPNVSLHHYMQLLHQGVDLMFIKEPHINTEYYKRMQNRKYEIAHTGKKSIDNLIQSVLDAITVFQDEETLEKIRIAFQQSEKEVTDLHQRISEGIKIVQRDNPFLPPAKQKQIGQVKGSRLTTKKSKAMKPLIKKMSKAFDGNMCDREIIDILAISRNTFYKYKNELFSELS